MKISSLEIQNIKSVGEKIQLHFEQGINIFIGPNGSGKSNVMDILNTVLHTYFIWHWHENIEPFGKITYQKQNLDGFFDLPKPGGIGGESRRHRGAQGAGAHRAALDRAAELLAAVRGL